MLELTSPLLSSVEPKQMPTFVKTIQSSLETPVFTMGLQNKSSPTMTIGAIDHTSYVGELTTVPVDPRFPGWHLNNVSFAVNGVSMGYTQTAMGVGKYTIFPTAVVVES